MAAELLLLVRMPFHLPLGCNSDAQEAADLRARQQMQASQIFKVQQKQYEAAHLKNLDEYLVSVLTKRWHVVLCRMLYFSVHKCTHSFVASSFIQEDLYEEDMSKKVRATGMIGQLFRKTENFELLLSHDTLLQVRSEVLFL